MSEANKRIALQFVEAMSTSNAELARPCLAPDAFTITKGHGKFAGRREAETMIGMIAAFDTLLPTGLNLEVVSVTAADDRVVVEAEGNSTTSAGTPYRNQYCFLFSFRDGKIARIDEYFCTVHADEVLWPLVEPHGSGN